MNIFRFSVRRTMPFSAAVLFATLVAGCGSSNTGGDLAAGGAIAAQNVVGNESPSNPGQVATEGAGATNAAMSDVAANMGGQSANCTSNADCAVGSGCQLPSGVCVPQCSEDGRCQSGRRCTTDGLCVEATSCQDSSGCPMGQACDTCIGMCVDGAERQCERKGDLRCLNSRDRGYEYCDTCSGQCRAVVDVCEPCTTDAQCGTNGVCATRTVGGSTGVFGTCLKSCANDIACEVLGAGFQCVEIGQGQKGCQPSDGQCRRTSACSMDGDCPPDAYCDQGRCIRGCTEGGCPTGQLCQGLRCGPPCSTANDCPMGLICESSGLCKVENGCVTSADCPDAETYCDRATQMCVPGCEVDLDCGDAGKTCSGGRCVERGCAAAFQCGFGQICNEESRQCMEAPGQHCMMGCDPESMTPCGLDGSQCLNLQDEDGNDLGAFCFEACAQEPNECPKGYGCQPIMDQSGNVMSQLCMRDCTIN
ncbi:MAG: hypothetical protein VX589_00320 [Myxococcota bacterium]|nr:hypothetical protein [Myxococcota bacterium]